MQITGTSPDGLLVEIVEIPEHPWFVAVQFHPEASPGPHDSTYVIRRFAEAVGRRRPIGPEILQDRSSLKPTATCAPLGADPL